MTAGIFNFTVDQGSVFDLEITYEDPNGVPINLTGFTAKMQLRKEYNSVIADLTLTTGGGGIVITGATGVVDVAITAAQTGTLEPTFYVYDLELISGSNISRLIQGQITVAEQVTQ